MRMKQKYFTPTHSMTFDEHMEIIKWKLVEVERFLKKEEEVRIKVEEAQSKQEIEAEKVR